MFLPETKRVRGGHLVFDRQAGMELFIPVDPEGRARLVVNPSAAFDRESFRSRKVNAATLVLACPAGRWERKKERCRRAQVVQAVHYRASQRDKKAREFFSGALQKRHSKDQERLREAQK